MEIREANSSDISKVKDLADKNKRELGFSIRAAFQEAKKLSELIVLVNGESLEGYCMYHLRRDRVGKVYQMAVARESRRRGYGAQLIDAVCERLRMSGATEVELLCPEDLEANEFYKSIGFDLVAIAPGKIRRLVRWSKKIS